MTEPIPGAPPPPLKTDFDPPAGRNDLKETILRQRRPELYGVLAPKTATP